MGVQTLYGHLSSMDVETGDRVEKGETIGRSGTTGLAGGDHVHFTVLVGGTPVNAGGVVGPALDSRTAWSAS